LSGSGTTLSVTGDVDFIGAGGGANRLDATAATGDWNVDGVLDISGGFATSTTANLTLAGNYINNAGVFAANGGTMKLDGTSQQTLTGAMTGLSAFYKLTVTNNWGNGDATNTPSVMMLSSASTTDAFTLKTAGTSMCFATTTNAYTFASIDWTGAAGAGVIKLRSADSCPLSTGVINSVSKYLWWENIGWGNAGTGYGIKVNSTVLYGWIWLENAGWVSLNCANTNSCGEVDYKVSNTAGALSGYAWGENIGWINFNPTNGGVNIDSNGDFSGYAWGENVGWIVFNCGTTASCSGQGGYDYKVNTTRWRP